MNIRFLRERKLTTAIALIVLVLAVIIVGLYIYGVRTGQPSLSSFVVNADRNFNAYGQNLSRVEIWEEPTGTTVEPSDDQLLERMNLAATNSGQQVWVAIRPLEPILASKIYARGFDANGNEVGRIELPYLGATEIYNALWGTSTPQ